MGAIDSTQGGIKEWREFGRRLDIVGSRQIGIGKLDKCCVEGGLCKRL